MDRSMEKSIVKDRDGYVAWASCLEVPGWTRLVYASFECLGAESWEFEILQTETIPFDESTRQGLRNLGQHRRWTWFGRMSNLDI